MELTLKDESVKEIGQSIGDRVSSMASTGTSLVPAGGAIAPAQVAQPMTPFDSMITVLSEIRDGIYQLVDKFSEGNSLQQEQIQQEEMTADLNQVGGADEEPVDTGPTDDRSFLQKGKDKVSELMGAGGFKGLLVKGGLIFGLLGIATMLKKYGGEIAKAITPVVDGIKAFYGYVKDDIGEFFGDVFDTVKETVDGIVNIFKGIFGGDGDLLRDGLADLLALPAKFVSMIGKLAIGVIDSFLKVFGVEETPEWLQKMYDFLDELPAKVKEFFVSVMEFFTVTIPEKIQSAKDTVSTWFTDTVTGIKQFFTDIGNFFTVTIPTKLTEMYENVTSFFGDIVLGVKGFFTDAFNFVTETIPNKIGEISKGITDKFTEIKDQIIDFAMAPFNKIKELMQGLLVGVLESVEGLPFIGDKAKAMKESILGVSGDAGTETIDTAGTGDASIAEAVAAENPTIMTNNSGDVVDLATGDKVKFGRNDEESASMYAAELSKLGQGKFEPYYETKGFNHYAIRKVGESIQGTAQTTGGATGSEMNSASGEFVAAGNGSNGGVNVQTGGNTSVNNSSSVTHNSMSEETGTSDKNIKSDLQD